MKIISFWFSTLLFGTFGMFHSTTNIKEYCNKYDVCVSYDGDLFEGPSESGSQDGAHFYTENPNNEMSMGADYREQLDDYLELAGEAQLKKLYADDQKDAQYQQITYKKLGTNWYVLSGYLKNEAGNKIIFYKKVIQASRLSFCMVQYEEADKEYWNPVCKLVSSSFK
jgi:hypothetical protein